MLDEERGEGVDVDCVCVSSSTTSAGGEVSSSDRLRLFNCDRRRRVALVWDAATTSEERWCYFHCSFSDYRHVGISKSKWAGVAHALALLPPQCHAVVPSQHCVSNRGA